MDSTIEKKEKNIVKISFTIPPERVEEGMNHSYNMNKGKVNLPGFRKGKAPRALIERHYGPGFLMDDALDYIFPPAYKDALKEHDISPVSRPEIETADYDKQNGMAIVVNVTVKPDVTLGEYKGVSYEDYEVGVTDEEIDEEIGKDREKNARIITVERPAQNGDTAVIDFEGFVDGEPFEGGKGENYNLVLGSHTFIDTFEEQLIGKSVGDTLDVSVTFPDNYGNAELAGKPAIFVVSVKEITSKELPALDDDFAQDLSGYDTFEEYKKGIEEKLKSQKEHKKEHDIEDVLIKTVADSAQIDVPEVMIEEQIERMVGEFEERLRMQGLDFSAFLNYSGQSIEQMKEAYREPAENNVRARLVLEKIAETEGLTASEEEIAEETAKIAKAYGIPEDKIKEIFRDEDLRGLEGDIKTQKAFRLIKESAVKK